ncbi:hypothetical protein [Polaribacter sargassicola]|uniref:hypothetical protein n=1 Tax=Polaribacter sargassicola TaxID=2836891 RepID=UPI001F24AFB7|nr:hypothetical protein [Polaribacter sp. DS7-9]MCG1035976.1 hypothetical protein [Polaribacter sp. DS7-9]
MKQKHQIFKAFLLIAIYCFGLGLSAKTLPYLGEQNVVENQENVKYLITSSKVLYTHTQQAENSVSELLEYFTPNFLFAPSDILATSYLNKLLFNAKYKQYINQLDNTRIKYRKSDIIFPFHNFW